MPAVAISGGIEGGIGPWVGRVAELVEMAGRQTVLVAGDVGAVRVSATVEMRLGLFQWPAKPDVPLQSLLEKGDMSDSQKAN